jgi:uncharacterized protein with HEPN domain
MTKEELQQHINRISDLSRDCITRLQNVPFEQFRKDEELKEVVYLMLQEIGQTAHEVEQYYEGDEKLEVPTDVLSNLRDARFHQMAERSHQQIYYIVTNDLPEIQESLIHLERNL